MFSFLKNKRVAEISRSIIDNSEDGIVAIDHRHTIILFNDGACQIFGYARDEVMGQHISILMPERFHLQHDLLIDDFGNGTKTARPASQRMRQTFGRRKDGSEFAASISIIKTGDGSSRSFAAVVRDISENKKTEDELLRLASTDPLTGAYNRREFTALADLEAQRSHRYGHPLSIMMLDLDHFKKLNDTYGHGAGDKALQRFTTICCNALRTVDIFGRWGGEEFVVLLPETDADSATVIAERLRKLTSQSILVYNDQRVQFTVSIGIAQYRPDELTVEGPLSRADSAVYDAKKAGRNQISVYRNE